MKWNKDRVLFALIVFITVWFTLDKIREVSFIQSQYSAVSVRLKTGSITERSLNAALKKEQDKKAPNLPEATAWVRIAEAEVKNKALNRTGRVSVTIVNGNMSLTAPMTLVSGNYVYQGDKKGCVIDTKTAYALFGTERAAANVVTYENKNYIIRGVVKTDYPVLLIQGDKDKREYTNLELTYKNEEMGESLTGEFLFQNGLAADAVIIDGYFYGRMIHSLVTLPIWIFFFFTAYRILLWCLKKKNKPLTKIYAFYIGGMVLCLIGFGLLLYQLTGNPFYIAGKLIPTKWSDFDYWSEQFEQIKYQIQQIRYLNPNPKDVFLMDEITKLSLNVMVMVVLNMFILMYIRIVKDYKI